MSDGTPADKVDRQLKVLQKKLARSTKARAVLEEVRDKNQHLLLSANAEIAASHKLIEEQDNELKRLHEELTKTQDRLVMQEKMASLGSLVVGVAHEINNPVGAMHAAADTAQRAMEKLYKLLEDEDAAMSDPKIRKLLAALKDSSDIVVQGSTRVTEIVKNLKHFARLDEAELQEVDVHEGIDSTLALLAHKFGHKISLHRDYTKDGTLCCFPQELNQVFMNLLSNACDAVDGEGNIRVETRREDEAFVVVVADDGMGITPEDLPRVFDPGFTKKDVGVGTGLGLSICHNIVAKHLGTIEVESSPGKGARFTMRIPHELHKRL